ncbi:MAG: hypothetical protein ACYCYP_00535 [Leptospirales bacterium]
MRLLDLLPLRAGVFARESRSPSGDRDSLDVILLIGMTPAKL